MQLRYDPEADAVYVVLGERKGRVHPKEVGERRFVDYDDAALSLASSSFLSARASTSKASQRPTASDSYWRRSASWFPPHNNRCQAKAEGMTGR